MRSGRLSGRRGARVEDARTPPAASSAARSLRQPDEGRVAPSAVMRSSAEAAAVMLVSRSSANNRGSMGNRLVRSDGERYRGSVGRRGRALLAIVAGAGLMGCGAEEATSGASAATLGGDGDPCNPRLLRQQCLDHLACARVGSAATCVPRCPDAPCPATRSCDPHSGLCLDLRAKAYGEACHRDGPTCGAEPNSVCLVTSGRAGFCSLPCASFTNPCPPAFGARAVCSAPNGDDGVCIFACGAGRDPCPPELTCTDLANGGRACLP